ncbi:MAG: MerR family transcriptional regulator [Acutalibacter sp.]|nr:MerR family transcriptional regulator [Acutalibacter sp.]
MERELMTVTQVSHMLGLSTRMLRYYEGKGLVSSSRREGYAYRMYDGEAVSRLRQIILLRRLRLSLEQIGKALGDPTAREAIRICEEKLEELGREAAALEAVRDILGELLEALKSRYWMPAGQTLLENSRLLALAEAFTPPNLKSEKERARKMEELTRAEEAAKLKDVRIIHLPASAVAAARYAGPEPENHAGRMIAEFARQNRLWETSSSLRLFGFNSPNPPPEGGEYGYEFWLTIPEDMEVPAPLEKKHFPGGTYAAHCIRMGDFHEWAWLARWVEESEEYEGNGSGTPENMFGGLEEHLNYYGHIKNTPEGEPETVQLDLLIPVKTRVRG